MIAPIAAGEVGGLTCYVLPDDVCAIVLPHKPDGSDRTAWYLQAAARATPIPVSTQEGGCVAYDAVELMALADELAVLEPTVLGLGANASDLVVDLVRLGVGALTLDVEVDRRS